MVDLWGDPLHGWIIILVVANMILAVIMNIKGIRSYFPIWSIRVSLVTALAMAIVPMIMLILDIPAMLKVHKWSCSHRRNIFNHPVLSQESFWVNVITLVCSCVTLKTHLVYFPALSIQINLRAFGDTTINIHGMIGSNSTHLTPPPSNLFHRVAGAISGDRKQQTAGNYFTLRLVHPTTREPLAFWDNKLVVAMLGTLLAAAIVLTTASLGLVQIYRRHKIHVHDASRRAW